MQASELAFNTSIGSGDITLQRGGFKATNWLATAVFISLFTDRRADDSDVLPDDGNDLRGCWSDPFYRESRGSKLWLLEREKLSRETVNRASDYIYQALQWLIDDGRLQGIAIDPVNAWQLLITLIDSQNTVDTLSLAFISSPQQFIERIELNLLR